MSPLNLFINIDTLSTKPENYHLRATHEERVDIAKRLSLLSLEKLEANLQLQKKEHIYLSGEIIADATQQCVRMLVPLPEHLEIEVDEIFSLLPVQNQKHIELVTEEIVEPLEDEPLNLGEVVIQLLSLNLNPYPVALGSVPVEYREKETSSPFDVLKKKD